MPSIALAADHAGFELKERIKTYLEQRGYTVVDYGTHSSDSVDYPDFAHPLAQAVEAGQQQLGFLFCGSANGVSIAANKHAGIRCALCWMPEIAQLARQHNNANVCAMPARYISTDEAVEIARQFLSTEFEGGRHQRRVEKIAIC
ncbi:MAG: ribose 5-phosphate isomerase B [Bacteroidales bacterium]|nr:ribose 5-phosphate isomerase B [Bacteroidales bacterium]